MSTRFLNRRALLQGAFATGTALAIPIPLLDIMFNNNGTALAAGTPSKLRYCTWFFGNGNSPPLWNPAQTGTGMNWALSEQLAPLKNVKSKLTVVSGLKNMLSNAQPHPMGSAASTTGGPIAGGKATADSIDQIVNAMIGGGKRTYEIGVSDATPNGAELTLKAVSHLKNGTANYPIFDPKSAFTALFGNFTAPGTGGTAAADQLAKLNKAKKSVLDLVLADATELEKTLGANDKKRMDQHMTGLRALETSLESNGSMPSGATAQCVKPASPTLGKDAKSEAPSNVNNLMADLMVMALACNVTRAASMVFTLPAAHVFYRSLGTDMNDDFHDTICHTDAGDEGHQPRVNRGVIYAMTNFAYFLEKLDSMTEGAGTLLDSSLIYATSCTAWGKTHGVENWPVLLAGKADGALKGDLHIAQAGQNLSKAMFSIQQIAATAAGVAPLAKVGGGAGEVSSGITGLV